MAASPTPSEATTSSLDPGLPISREDVEAFFEAYTMAAKRALKGAHRPGNPQLFAVHHKHPERTATRPRVIDNAANVEAAVAWSIRHSREGHNVYIETRTIAEDVRRLSVPGARGSAKDTRAVFAFVVDRDGDAGKAGRALALEPTFIFETSPGNFQEWFVLSQAIPPDSAEALGKRFKAAAGADSATGTVTQPYRIPGLPNLATATKLARGRSPVEPCRLIKADSPTYTAEQLEATLPPLPEKEVKRKRTNGAAVPVPLSFLRCWPSPRPSSMASARHTSKSAPI